MLYDKSDWIIKTHNIYYFTIFNSKEPKKGLQAISTMQRSKLSLVVTLRTTRISTPSTEFIYMACMVFRTVIISLYSITWSFLQLRQSVLSVQYKLNL